MINYHVNEFAVESEFTLPCDAAGCSTHTIGESDQVTIQRASLANVACTMRRFRRQLIYDVGDGFLLEPGTSRGMLALHIDFKGRVLTVDCPDDMLQIAWAWAIHAGLGAATLTHGGIPLHGAGLEIDGRYIALMADSGSGKSTLSWFLMQRGARFGNDDLVPVRLVGDGAIAFPSVSLYPKLSREAVDQHSLDIANLLLADYGTNEEEYYVPLSPAQRVTAPHPLAAVFLIRPQMLPQDGLLTVRQMRELVEAQRLPEDEAADIVRQNLHAAWLIQKWMDGRRLDEICRRLAARVPVYMLTYPRFFAVLPEIAATISRTLETR